VTGNGFSGSFVDGMNAGADDFMYKPVNQEELRVRIRAGERLIALKEQLNEKNKILNEYNNKLTQTNQQLAAVNINLSKAYEKIRKDLELAANIQKSLLPQISKIESLSFEWLFLPSDFLAGDMFGFFRLDENHIALYHLDVSGHGTSSALLSFALNRMLSQNSIKDGLLKEPLEDPPYYKIVPPHLVVSELNQKFKTDHNLTLYFTIIYGLFDIRTKVLTFTQAGHPPFILAKKSVGELCKVGKGGFPVGMFEELDYESLSISLDPGDRLFLYSDGLTDCKNQNSEKFSEQKLIDLLKSTLHRPLSDVSSFVRNSISEWKGGNEFEDDITLLAIELDDY
jgi:sigma-B regulation protein RsbU (phosphoserine phosphatase)